MPKLTKIYTRQGDQGVTSLGGGRRVRKDTLRVRVYGAIDELNSIIGVACAQGVSDGLHTILRTIQNDLFHLGVDLSFPQEDRQDLSLPGIEAKHIAALEGWIDELNEFVGPLENFILPGGTLAAAHLHVARAVCRRAERELVALADKEPLNPYCLPYLNRLSDALFVFARYENKQRGAPEPTWDSRA